MELVWLLIDPSVVPRPLGPDWHVSVPPVHKHPSNPLMIEDRLWDVRWDNSYPTIRWEAAAQKYRMWHSSSFSCDRPPRLCSNSPPS